MAYRHHGININVAAWLAAALLYSGIGSAGGAAGSSGGISWRGRKTETSA